MITFDLLDRLPLFQQKALRQRIEAVTQVVLRLEGKSTATLPFFSSHQNSPISSSALFLNFLEFMKQSPLSNKEKHGLCYLALTAEYPDQNKIGSIRACLEKTVQTWLSDRSIQRLIRHKLVRNLIVPDPDCLYIDITHTVLYPYSSGIQRVVRKTVEAFARQNRKVNYFTYNPEIHGPQPLKPLEISALQSYLNKNYSEPLSNRGSDKLLKVMWLFSRFLKAPMRILKYFLSDLILITARNFHRFKYDFLTPVSKRFEVVKKLISCTERIQLAIVPVLDSKKYKHFVSYFIRTHQKIYLFFDSKLLLPELTTGEQRPQFYIDLKLFNRISLNVLTYDLIPLLTPNNCTNTDIVAFVHYLRIFGVADRLIGISKSVENDIKAFTGVLQRRTDSPVQISHIWLAGDFIRNKGEHNRSTSTLQPAKHPRILCVGTLEKRKNQTTILRSAHALKEKGFHFEICFVGNQGWGGDQFIKEARQLDPNNEYVRIFYNLKDNELLDLYLTSHFSMFCSLIEGFGLPILESLQLNCPVITSNRGSMSEIARQFGGCELVDPENQIQIEEAMARLLSDTEYYEKKKSEIRETSNISWDQFSSQLYETCHSI